MFLKTVPPAVAIHSEWRSSKGCSLPLFFNDSASDSDLASVSGTPIPQKIQMIIESLHCTQSSDMSDNVPNEKAAHSSHEAGNKGQAWLVDRSQRIDAKRQTVVSDTGEDSDSDDSVDRGIEEAIQEYLKERVDHKRKGDLVTSPSPAAKLPRREPNASEVAKQHTHSSGGKVLTASNHIQRASTETQPLKKKVKKKKLSKENPFKKADVSTGLPVKSPILSRTKKGSSSSSEMDRSPPRLIIKEEDEWPDSSSDDGIEQEIQKFQQEKKVKEEDEKETKSSQQTKDSDSSSDEGIEEAIRLFQEEKHKTMKCLLTPPQHVPAQRSKPAVVSPECTNTQPVKTLSKKNNKKKLTTTKSDLPAALSVNQFINDCSSQDSKDCIAAPTDTQERQIHSSLNVNTAELLCAEAILDISKTVMPEVFDSNLTIANRDVLQTFPAAAPCDDRSNDSSVDSEEGIEQEIRKFLELKAQMNKEPSVCSGDPAAGKEPKKKTKETQPSKAIRLSLSRKRKIKEEQSKQVTDGDVKEEPSRKTLAHSESTTLQISLPELPGPPSVTSHPCSVKNNKPNQNSRKVSEDTVPKDKSCSVSSPPNAMRIGSERYDSSDKSSSLDSDEDLDAAIKDLLKTKKKVKKKVRDMKARKGLRPSETFTLDTLKKHKPITEQKTIPPAKTVKPTVLKVGTPNVQTKSKSVKSRSEAKNTDRVTGNDQESVLPSSIQHADEDDSDVDSDDSIEQEIRRFLAERAKVATPATVNVKQEEGAEEILSIATERDVKSEHEQIPIETSTSGRLQDNETRSDKESAGVPSFAQRQTDSCAEADKGPGSSCIISFMKTENEKTEISTTRDPRNGSSQKGKDGLTGKGTPVSHNYLTSPSMSSNTPRPSGRHHQNLFLMTPCINELKKRPSTDCNELQRRPTPRIPLSEVIRSVCPSPSSKTKPPTDKPTTGDLFTSTTPGDRTEEIYLHNHTKDKKDRYLTDKTPITSHLYQPSPHLGGSVIQVQRDQTAHKTNQVTHNESRSSLGVKQRVEDDRKNEKKQEGEMKEDEEEKCVDETDVESDEDRKDEKMRAERQQHQPNQIWSTCIDPGILPSPYIALNTEERRLKFQSRRFQVQKQLQCSTSVKRRLQFVVSVPR
nr:protein phosphatase 1 regulatory subunit 26 isoform X1 [Misgurnus anguillicaudatus]XP_055035967.1 protein phosphatase 1 regulatory subunit 26 isoform X2 [Misgurnus anguillicaudatus]